MEVLCKSDYQDLYRVMDGVLLVVNKFRYILCVLYEQLRGLNKYYDT